MFVLGSSIAFALAVVAIVKHHEVKGKIEQLADILASDEWIGTKEAARLARRSYRLIVTYGVEEAANIIGAENRARVRAHA